MSSDLPRPTPLEPAQILKMKEEKLYDLICRACANGTAKEVAAAIAVDWIPTIEIDGRGNAKVLIGRESGGL